MNPYHVLGVTPDANLDTLKAAYRRLAREHHPDSAPNEAARVLATQRMALINGAWQTLGDPSQRAAFDARARLDALNQSAARDRETGQRPAPPTAPRGAATARPSGAPRPTRPTATARTPRANATATKTAIHPKARRNATATRVNKASSSVRLAEAARLFREQNRPDPAIALCILVLRTDFRSVAARELLSDIYMAQNQPHRAFALLEQALVLEPNNAALVRKINQLSQASGRLRSASAAARQTSAAPRPSSPNAPSALRPTGASWWTRLRPQLRWLRVPRLKLRRHK